MAPRTQDSSILPDISLLSLRSSGLACPPSVAPSASKRGVVNISIEADPKTTITVGTIGDQATADSDEEPSNFTLSSVRAKSYDHGNDESDKHIGALAPTITSSNDIPTPRLDVPQSSSYHRFGGGGGAPSPSSWRPRPRYSPYPPRSQPTIPTSLLRERTQGGSGGQVSSKGEGNNTGPVEKSSKPTHSGNDEDMVHSGDKGKEKEKEGDDTGSR